MISRAAVAELTPEGAKKKTFRPDIQGLRMIAVLAVMSDHLFQWPSGGFVGVDVFFVISGFLITSLLLREYDATGKISFTGFYIRRVRRILPAAMLVIIVTVATAFFVFNRARAAQVLWDGVWATFFGANWRFAIEETDYFNAGAAISPLQHYWSLAVEEQFYFVWPWLMLLILWIVKRSHSLNIRVAHQAIGMAMLAIVVASFAWAWWQTASNPTLAYFSTFTRAWELGMGALLAVVAPRFSRISSQIRPVLGWLGLVGIVASLFVVNDEYGAFPAPWAAFPVLATALVIAAGTGGELRFLWPIMNPASSWIGDVSYSLYVWHFPVIIIAATLMPAGPTYYVLCAALILALSATSYYLVENPIRRLGRRPEGERSRRVVHSRRRSPYLSGLDNVWKNAGVSALAAATLGMSAFALAPRPVPVVQSEARTVVDGPLPTPTASGITGPTSASEARQLEVRAALSAESWPELNPKIDNVTADSRVPEWRLDGCLGGDVGADSDPIANAERCVYGNPDSEDVAVVLGDSIAISYLPGIRAALEPAGYRVEVLTMQQCPTAMGDFVKGNGSPHSLCPTFRDWAINRVRQIHPQLLIISNSEEALNFAAGGENDAERIDAYENGVTQYFANLPGISDRIVVLDSPVFGRNVQECVTAFSLPADCESAPSGRHKQQEAILTAAVRSIQDKQDIVFVASESWFCASDCPAFVGGSVVFADGHHLTESASRDLAAVLQEVLLPTP